MKSVNPLYKLLTAGVILVVIFLCLGACTNLPMPTNDDEFANRCATMRAQYSGPTMLYPGVGERIYAGCQKMVEGYNAKMKAEGKVPYADASTSVLYMHFYLFL